VNIAAVYREGRFVRVLEGPKNVVKDLLARIARDERHEHVRVLASQRIPQRSCGDWTMGYEILQAKPETVPLGFRSTFDDLNHDDNTVVRRALVELTIWFTAHRRPDAL